MIFYDSLRELLRSSKSQKRSVLKSEIKIINPLYKCVVHGRQGQYTAPYILYNPFLKYPENSNYKPNRGKERTRN